MGKITVKENIFDNRFVGKSMRIRVLGYDEELEGVVDEVSKYEVGLRVRDRALVVFRHAILYAEVQPPDLHGYSQEEIEDTVITSDFVGSNVDVYLLNGARISGKLMKVTKYELGIVSNDRAYIIPKSSISYIVFT